MKKILTGLAISSFLFSGVNFATASDQIELGSISMQQEEPAEFIVGKMAGSTGIEEKVEILGGEVIESWKFINTLIVRIQPSKVNQLQLLDGVAFVNKNSSVIKTGKEKNVGIPDSKLLVNAYNSAIAADKVWSKGYTGEGITVAVVDSGLLNNPNSTDFKGRVIAETKTSSMVTNMSDNFGHGTHVASIIGGDGAVSGGKYVGVAPGVNLINVKISDDSGMSTEQDLVKGLEWIYENRVKYNIRVVNISSQLGTKQSYKESATAAAVEILWNSGVVVVVSAGNTGGTECSICHAPANDPFVITVGAVDDNGTKDISDDSLKSWSSSGITLDGHKKPEIVAPGSEIIAFMPKGNIRDIRPNNIVDKNYFKMGGTSMSAPVVSGVVALMLQVNPGLTPDKVKWILQNTNRNYLLQPEGTAGIISADAAVFFDSNNIPASATQVHELSPVLASLGNKSNSNLSWSNLSWSNLSWSNLSWSNLSWSNNFDY